MDADEQLGIDIGHGVTTIHRKLRSADLEQIEREFHELEERLIESASENPSLHHRIPLIKRRMAEGFLLAVYIKNGPYETGLELFQRVNDLEFDNVLKRTATYLCHADFCRKKQHKEEAIKALLDLKAYLKQHSGKEIEQYLATVESKLAKLA